MAVVVVIVGDALGDEVPALRVKALSSSSICSKVSSVSAISVILCTVGVGVGVGVGGGGGGAVSASSLMSIRRSIKSVVSTSPLWSS